VELISSPGLAANHYIRALSIRQPYAELIVCGIKTLEQRTQQTHIYVNNFTSNRR